MYAGKNSKGQNLVWHSGQDGVGRMRADRMRTNGVLNYIAHVYSYFEPPSSININVYDINGSKVSTDFGVVGPNGYNKTVTSDESGVISLTELDLGRYTFTYPNGFVRIIDLTEAPVELIITL